MAKTTSTYLVITPHTSFLGSPRRWKEQPLHCATIFQSKMLLNDPPTAEHLALFMQGPVMSPCINCCPLQREASRTKVESSTDLWVYTAFTVRCDNMTIWQNNSSRFSPRAYDSPQPWTLAQVSLWIRPHSLSESMLHYVTSGHIVPGWLVL